MAKGNREAFTLNELNPQEKVVSDFLQSQYNKSQVIKDILYEYIVNNNLQINTQPIQHKHVINTTNYVHNVSNVYKDIQQDGIKVDDDITQIHNKIYTNIQKDNVSNDNDFSIDLNNISDEEINMDTGEKENSANKNAMDFLLKM